MASPFDMYQAYLQQQQQQAGPSSLLAAHGFPTSERGQMQKTMTAPPLYQYDQVQMIQIQQEQQQMQQMRLQHYMYQQQQMHEQQQQQPGPASLPAEQAIPTSDQEILSQLFRADELLTPQPQQQQQQQPAPSPLPAGHAIPAPEFAFSPETTAAPLFPSNEDDCQEEGEEEGEEEEEDDFVFNNPDAPVSMLGNVGPKHSGLHDGLDPRDAWWNKDRGELMAAQLQGEMLEEFAEYQSLRRCFLPVGAAVPEWETQPELVPLEHHAQYDDEASSDLQESSPNSPPHFFDLEAAAAATAEAQKSQIFRPFPAVVAEHQESQPEVLDGQQPTAQPALRGPQLLLTPPSPQQLPSPDLPALAPAAEHQHLHTQQVFGQQPTTFPSLAEPQQLLTPPSPRPLPSPIFQTAAPAPSNPTLACANHFTFPKGVPTEAIMRHHNLSCHNRARKHFDRLQQLPQPELGVQGFMEEYINEINAIESIADSEPRQRALYGNIKTVDQVESYMEGFIDQLGNNIAGPEGQRVSDETVEQVRGLFERVWGDMAEDLERRGWTDRLIEAVERRDFDIEVERRRNEDRQRAEQTQGQGQR